MVGVFIAFGADMILFYGALSVLVFAFGGSAWKRWRRLRRTSADPEPHETLKARCAGELSEAGFEEKLDTLLESDRQVEQKATDTEQQLTNENSRR